MPFHMIQSRVDPAESFDAEVDVDADLDLPWVEAIVATVVTAFTVLFVSSVAVLMYLA